jgi:glycosyltransferase involved in cell wall biosynthesis
MKVMMVVARLNIGGVALNVIQMVDALSRLPDMEVILVNGRIGEQEGDMQYLADQYGIQQIILPSLGRELSPLRDLQTICSLWRLMRRYRPDVVHTHTAKAGWVGRWAAWLAGIPVRVHTFHGHVFRGYFSPLKTALFLRLEQLTARLSTRIITLSETLRVELADLYHVTDQDRIEVIPLGLALQPFADRANQQGTLRKTFHLPPDAPLIGVIGRLVPVKNHRLFLQTAELLHQQRPDVRFVIIGDGELRQTLEKEIIERGLLGIVIITGWLEDVIGAYNDLDLVTITSDNEGTPVSLIEAIAAGIPVVSTDVGGVADLFGENLADQCVPAGDAHALCAAWLRTLDHPPTMEKAQARILSRYDIQQVAVQHADLYRRLLNHD